jgi:hypothetical protein
MQRFRRLSRGGRLLVTIAVGGAVFGIATAVQASIPDSSGVIHGCYAKAGNPSQGALRVVDQGVPCKPIENPLSWNAKGVSGATGPTGPSGPSAFTGHITGIPTTSVQIGGWGAPSGLSGLFASPIQVETLSPNAAFVAQDLSVAKTGLAVPGPDGQITVDLLVNGSTGLTCVIQVGSTNCNSGGQTANVPSGSTLSIEMIIQPPTAGTINSFELLFGWRAT